MASILIASGFRNLESLQEFSSRFPNVSVHLDEDLRKIWICHKNSEDIPKCEEMNLLPYKDYDSLSKKIKLRISFGEPFYSLLTEFSAYSVFDKIYCQFNKQLTTYLFTKCYIFYNWGVNAFEPVIDHFEIHSKIQEMQKKPFAANQRKSRCDQNFFKHLIEINTRKENNGSGIGKPLNLAKCRTPKPVSLQSVVQAYKKAKKFYDFSKNPFNPYQEMFNLKKILYDSKQRGGWPKKHVLSRSNVEDLVVFIIQVPVVTKSHVENVLLTENKKWLLFRELLEKFRKNHESINRNDGYGRILKKHLKSVEITPDRRLQPIPKSTVCSYVLDILRRVLPFELFGWNRVRKNFFLELIKVLKGNKDENFIWYPLLRSLLLKKSDLAWCSQMGDNYIQSQVILKLFKFIVIHYVFVLVRNNFYLTEIGSSGFGLRYYRKSDMESASFACAKNLLENRHIQPLGRNDHEPATVERNWLNTGVIAERDLRKKLKNTMSPDTEYRQPIAHIRFLPKTECRDELRIITYIIKKMPKRSDAAVHVCSKKLEQFFSDRLARRKKNLFFVKLLLEFIVDKMGFGIRPLPCNTKLEAAWKKAVYLKEKYGKLYFVKADISDAFDSVNYHTLIEILRGAIEKESEVGKVKLKKLIEWKRTSRKIEKVVRFSFSNRPKENSVMINRSFFLHPNKKINHCLDIKFLQIVQQVVMQQRIEINGRVFKLIKGLAQGSAGRFSPQLCEIYYSSMDKLYFSEFINSNDSLLLRGVDDYLFISSDLGKSKKFLDLVQHGIPDYDVKFNKLKLKSNLVENIQEVSYLGLSFNFEHMFVKPNYSKYLPGNILSTINLIDKWGSNHFKKKLFLQRRSLRIKCLKLHPIVTNGIYNNIKVMRQTVFEACLMQSLRVMELADYLYPDEVKNDSAVYEVLLISCSRIKRLLATCGLSIDEINWIFFFAALNISQKYSGQFKLLSLMIRFRMQKCEKTFSKNGDDLLLDFLKNDLSDEEYWEKIEGNFKNLGKPPLKKV